MSKNIFEYAGIKQTDPIEFYRATGEYGFLSNLYRVKVEFEGITFDTAEHAYQYGKFKDPEVREWAMQAPKPHLLAILAHGLFKWDIVPNWTGIKVNRMLGVLQAKFDQHPEIAKELLKTGNAVLIENSTTDSFWGIGKSRKGHNMLGKLLMQVRDELKQKDVKKEK